MDFFQVVNNGVIAVPYETGLILGPVGVPLCRHAVVGMVESFAVFPVRSEYLCEPATRPAPGTLGKFEGGLCARIPECACWRYRPVIRQIQLNVVTIWRVRPGCCRYPENSRRPCRLLRQNIGAGKAPISLQGAGTKFG